LEKKDTRFGFSTRKDIRADPKSIELGPGSNELCEGPGKVVEMRSNRISHDVRSCLRWVKNESSFGARVPRQINMNSAPPGPGGLNLGIFLRASKCSLPGSDSDYLSIV
jgi:hypothetical protein